MQGSDQRERIASLDFRSSATHVAGRRDRIMRIAPQDTGTLEKAGLLIGNLAFWSTLGFGVCMGLLHG
jgi:hypothetical protein